MIFGQVSMHIITSVRRFSKKNETENSREKTDKTDVTDLSH